MHIHSALSACGEDIMSPRLILEQAVQKKIQLISITDHNAIQHSMTACLKSINLPIRVIPGVELTTREEVHLLAYFPTIDTLVKMEKIIDDHLVKGKNNARLFGYQLHYDDNGEILEIDNRLRHSALNIGLDELIKVIHEMQGIAIPAHIDKNRFSLLSQLGFLDPMSKFDGVEVSKFKWRKSGFALGDAYLGFPVIAGSDSHSLEDIGQFFLEDDKEGIKDFFTLKKFLRNVMNEGHSGSPV